MAKSQMRTSKNPRSGARTLSAADEDDPQGAQSDDAHLRQKDNQSKQCLSLRRLEIVDHEGNVINDGGGFVNPAKEWRPAPFTCSQRLWWAGYIIAIKRPRHFRWPGMYELMVATVVMIGQEPKKGDPQTNDGHAS